MEVAVEVEVDVGVELPEDVGSVADIVVVSTGLTPSVAGTPYLGAGEGQPAATPTSPSNANTAVLGTLPSLVLSRAPQCGHASRDARSLVFTAQLQLGHERKGGISPLYNEGRALRRRRMRNC